MNSSPCYRGGEGRRGEERRGEERRGEERRGEERRGEERRGEGRRGEEKRGEGRRGEERKGEGRRGEERRGEGASEKKRDKNYRNTICSTCTHSCMPIFATNCIVKSHTTCIHKCTHALTTLNHEECDMSAGQLEKGRLV